MTRRILIALVLVPAMALAGPKKKGKAKKAAPAEAAKPEGADKPAEGTTPAATPPPAAEPAGMPMTTKGTAGTTLSSGTTPTTVPGAQPAASPAPPATPPNAAAGASEEPPPKDSKEPDVDALRQEYLSLRDELFKSRARANAVASQLYSTRVTIKFTWGSARYYGVSKASIRLDGATVFEDATGAIAADDGVRFDGYVAPGRHLVTFHVEATGKDDDSFTSATEAQIVVKAVANKDLVVSAKGRDSGDIAYEWKRSERGSYGLGIDVSVKSVASGAGKGKK
jgi:hypothetical protein